LNRRTRRKHKVIDDGDRGVPLNLQPHLKQRLRDAELASDLSFTGGVSAEDLRKSATPRTLGTDDCGC
jgi:hypothetical protein